MAKTKKASVPKKVVKEVEEEIYIPRNAMGNPLYTIDITMGDVHLHGEGKNAEEALASIKKPVKIITKTFISIRHGDKHKEIMFMPDKAKRMFQPLAQYLFARNFTFLLK